MAETVPLPLHCAHCGVAVWLTVEHWMEGAFTPQVWQCPITTCQQSNTVTMTGKIASIVAELRH